MNRGNVMGGQAGQRRVVPDGAGYRLVQGFGQEATGIQQIAAVREELGVLLPAASASARGLHWVLNATPPGIEEGEER